MQISLYLWSLSFKLCFFWYKKLAKDPYSSVITSIYWLLKTYFATSLIYITLKMLKRTSYSLTNSVNSLESNTQNPWSHSESLYKLFTIILKTQLTINVDISVLFFEQLKKPCISINPFLFFLKFSNSV